jgi:PAS domain S-box-containing protein
MSEGAKSGPTAKILICEDELLLAEDMALTLNNLGYDVVEKVSTGEEAVKGAEKSQPDLILMDIKIRGKIDGIEAAVMIRSRMDVPVVYLTGYGEKDIFERAKKSDPYGYLSKPVGILEMRSTIEMALYKHAADKKIRESERRYHSLIETMAEGVILQDSDYVIHSFNPAAERILGIPADRAIGKSSLEISWNCIREDGSVCPVEELPSTITLRTGQSLSKCIIGVLQENEVVWISVNTRPLFGNGSNLPEAVVTSFADITHVKKAEQALRKSEARFRELIDHSPMGMSVTDMNDKVVYVNNKFTELFGYTLEDIPTLDMWFQLAYPDPELAKLVKSEWTDAIRYACESGKEAAPAVRDVRCKDNTIRMVDFRKTVIDELVIHTLQDVTETMRQKEALQEKEKQLRLLADNTLDVIWQTDLDLRFTYVNPAIFGLTGHTPDEVIGCSLAQHCDEENLATLTQVASEEIAKGADSPGVIFEVTLLKKNREPVPVEIHGKVVLDANGLPTILQGVARNITQRKKTEERLRKSEEHNRFLASVIELSSQPFAVGNVDGSFAMVNKAYCDLLGYTEEEMRHIDWAIGLTPPEYRELQSSKLLDLIATGKPVRYEKEYIRKDGTRVPVELLVHRSTDRTGVPFYYSFITDLTERKRASPESSELKP